MNEKDKNGCKIVAHCETMGFSDCEFYETKNRYVECCIYYEFDGENDLCTCRDAIVDSAEKL